MRTRRFPRRVEILAAVLAAVLTIPLALKAAGGPGSSFITSHNFYDGYTDIPFSGVNDILQLGWQSNALRIIFDHSSPMSYNANTKLLQVQAVGGFTEDFSEWNPRVNIAAKVDNSGKLVPNDDAANYLCGGVYASFCVQGSDGTVWLRGQVKGFASRYNGGLVSDPTPGYGPYDDFAFYVKITGGARAANYGNYMAVSVHDFTLAGYGAAWNGSFTQPVIAGGCLDLSAPSLHTDCSFGGGILGVMGVSVEYGLLVDTCTGRISGTVKNGLMNSPMAGDQISLAGGDLVNRETRISAADGGYAFTTTALHATGLCAGTYTVNADVPDGFAPGDLNPTTQSVTLSVGGSGVANFVFYPVISSDFKTWGQGGWGAKPSGNNAGALLQNYYVVPYGNDPVVIGTLTSGKYASLSGPVGVQNFLPQGGKPAAFDRAYIDPGPNKPTNKLGTLAGETLALTLNADFSASGLTKVGLGSLFVASGPMANCSVNQVLTYANKLLGGGALVGGVKPEDATDTAGKINGNYEGGKGKGYLKPASAGACIVP